MTAPEENRSRTAKTHEAAPSPADRGSAEERRRGAERGTGPGEGETGTLGEKLREAMRVADVDRDDFA